jgi:Flp pilus assembly protein TadG
MLEFTLIGIGLIFALISFFEMARGMWTYQNLAYAVREAARYAAVHGKDCASPNTCRVSVGQIVGVLQSAGVGLDPNQTTVTLTSASGATTNGTVTSLLSNSTNWPPSTPATDYADGQPVKIKASYPFQTVLAMFWPGAGGPLNDSQTFNLAASSTELIQY